MKKILVIVLSAMLLLSMAACTVNEKPVAVLWSGSDQAAIPNSLINAMDRAMYIENISYQYYGANGDGAKQLSQAQEALNAGCPALLVELVDAASAQAIVDLAKAKNVPVVFFGCDVDAAVLASYAKCYQVNTDEATVKTQMETMLADYLKKNAKKLDRNEDKVIHYGTLCGVELTEELTKEVKKFTFEKVEVDAAAIDPAAVELLLTESDTQAFEILLYLQEKDYNTDKLVTRRVALFTVGNEVDYKDYVLSGAPEETEARKAYFEQNKYLVDLTAVKEEDMQAMIYTTVNVVDSGRICGTVMEDYDAIAVAAAELTAKLLTGKAVDSNVVAVSYTAYAK